MTGGKLIVIEGSIDINPEDPIIITPPSNNIFINGAEFKAYYKETQTKQNKLFTYYISQHLSKGYDVILRVGDLSHLDKRLRRPDLMIKLNKREV